jgi:succinyl-CoA synthetase beta subunit
VRPGPEPAASEGIRIADLSTWAGIEGLAAALGGRVPATRMLHSGEPVPSAELKSPPYVVKPLPNAVRHKTDRGLVHLNLYEPDDVAKAVALVRGAIGPEIPVLVQKMVSGVELLVTVDLHTDWGPVLTIGAGGVLVELLDDIAHVSLPCTEAEIAGAMSRLDIDQLLRGFRGSPPADRDAAVKAAFRLGRIALTHGDAIEEIEVNPLVVATEGEGVYVVDVLITQPESAGPK